MAEEKSEGSAWGPIGLLVLLIGGSLLALYVRGDLGKLDAKSLLTPAPLDTQTTPTPTSSDGSNYGGQLEQNAYSIDPHPVQVTQ